MAKRRNTSTFSDGIDKPDDLIIPFLDNPFVSGFKKANLHYTKDFDIAMYKRVKEEGMTYVEAYNALGFDTKVLGEARALAAGKNALRKVSKDKLYTVKAENYEGSAPAELIGKLTKEEETAYLEARVRYLERLYEMRKMFFQ